MTQQALPTTTRRLKPGPRAAELGRRVLASDQPYMLYATFVTLIVIFSVKSPVFFTGSNFANIGRQTALVSIIAVGMTFVIVAGEIDLSVGAVLALSAMVAAIAMEHLGNFWIVGALCGVAAGAVAGLVNGLLTTRLAIPSFLVTLGTLGIARGIALILTDTRPVIITNTRYNQIFGEGNPGGVPAPVFWTLVIAGLGTLLLHFSTFGRKVYSTGGNVTAARYSGIRTGNVKTIAFVLTGALAGVAALVLSGQSEAARPDFSAGLELDVIASVILGGTSLFGGVGTIVGTILGSLTIGILNNGLVLLGVSSSVQLVIKGAIIIAAVAFSRKRR